jgi:hypothetical protein
MYAKTKQVFIIAIILFTAAALTGTIYIGASLYKAQRAVAERDRLIGEYRERDADAARINRELTERNSRLTEGLESIREIAGSSATNIRQAISIIAGVKSVLEALEDDGIDRHSAGNSGGHN